MNKEKTELKTLKDIESVKLHKKHKLIKCWIWPQTVYNFVKNKSKGYTLNICCGMNDIGNVRVDLDPKDKSIIKADMRELPFKDNTFDTVIQDPPWKIDLFSRFKPFFECVRVCKVGGQIIYNAYWLPQSKIVKLKELYVRQDNEFSNASLIAVYEKIRNLTEEDLK